MIAIVFVNYKLIPDSEAYLAVSYPSLDMHNFCLILRLVTSRFFEGLVPRLSLTSTLTLPLLWKQVRLVRRVFYTLHRFQYEKQFDTTVLSDETCRLSS